MRAAAPFVTALLLSVPAFAQAPSESTQSKCDMRGRVSNALTGEPISNASLTLMGDGDSDPRYYARTAADGRFVFEQVRIGTYYFSAQKNGYLQRNYGEGQAARSGRVTIGQCTGFQDLVFRLIPASVITGRVVDESGEPVADAEVDAWSVSNRGGKKQYRSYGHASTNDLGEYRIFGLSPGDYVVSATCDRSCDYRLAQRKGEKGYVPVFYPATIDASNAQTLRLRPGQSAASIDIAIFLSTVFKVSGRVINASTGQPAEDAHVNLHPRNAELVKNVSQSFSTSRDGRFEVANVVAGSYILSADAPDREQRRMLLGRQIIEVTNASLDSIQLTISPTLEIRGKITTSDNSSIDFDAPENQIQVSLRAHQGWEFGGAFDNVSRNGTFTLQNASPGIFDLHVVGLPGDFYLKSARFGPRSIPLRAFTVDTESTSSLLEVTVSPKGGRIEGMAVTPQGLPAFGAAVVLFPAAIEDLREPDFISSSSNEHGQFTLKGIPPGEYKLLAWEEIGWWEWANPEILKPHRATARSLRIEESAHLSLEVKAIARGSEKP